MVNRTVDIQFLAGRALTTDLLQFYLEHNTLLHRKMVMVTTDGLNEIPSICYFVDHFISELPSFMTYQPQIL